jgi:hypothetical protein
MITLSVSPKPKCLLQGTDIPNTAGGTVLLTAGASGYIFDSVSIFKTTAATVTLYSLPTAGTPVIGDTVFADNVLYPGGNLFVFSSVGKPPYKAAVLSGLGLPANHLLYGLSSAANSVSIRVTGRDLADSTSLAWSPVKELFFGRTIIPQSSAYATVFTASVKTLIDKVVIYNTATANTSLLARIVASGGSPGQRYQIQAVVSTALYSINTTQHAPGFAGQVLEPGDFIQAAVDSATANAYMRIYGREAI